MTSQPRKSLRRFAVALAGVCLSVAAFGLFPQGASFVIDSDRKIYDRIIRTGGGPPERDDFVLLGIDEASMSLSNLTEEEIAASEALQLMRARFPWDRRVWAEAIDRLCEAGARLVVLDLIFAEPGEPEGDDALAAAIARHPSKVVLGSAFSPLGQQEDGHEVFMLTEPYVLFLESDPEPRIGFVNMWPDQRDGSIRIMRYRSSLGRENQQELKGEAEVLSLSGQIMDAYGAEIPEQDVELRFASEPETLGTEIYAPRSVHEIFAASFWEKNYDHGKFFKDKVVLIGPIAERFQDIHETPVGTISGPQLHLQAAACGLAQAYVHHLGHPVAVMVLLGLIASALVTWIERPKWSAVAMLLLLIGFAVLVWVMGDHFSVMIPVVGGLLAATLAWIFSQADQLIRERLEKERLRSSLRRFVSRDVAQLLVEQPDRWKRIAAGGKRRLVVLFSDVRGFTTYAEQAEPTELLDQLNEYFTVMVDVVFRHGGTLDKFIGDAVMAHWGAIDDGEDADHARAAIAAALDMQAELKVLNERWVKEGRQALGMGIGLHLGEAVAGEIGSPERIEFGVIGDAVNLASRLEGLTKFFDCDVVFSDAVYQAAKPDDAQSLGALRVAGRSQVVVAHAFGDGERVKLKLAGFDRDAEGAIVMESK